jgi:hypothetical protein
MIQVNFTPEFNFNLICNQDKRKLKRPYCRNPF